MSVENVTETALNGCALQPALSVAPMDPQPPTPYRRRYSLKTLRGVRSEMAAVYREMRRGTIESQDGTRCVYVLAQIGKMIELADLERRLAALESKDYGNT